MSKCPSCNKEITYLIISEGTISKYKVGLNEDDDLAYDLIETIGDDCQEEKDYACPECYRIIFDDYKEVINFLKGDEDYVEDIIEWVEKNEMVFDEEDGFDDWESKERHNLITDYKDYLRDVLDDDNFDLTTIEDYWAWTRVEFNRRKEVDVE